jgi:hypothetical protein
LQELLCNLQTLLSLVLKQRKIAVFASFFCVCAISIYAKFDEVDAVFSAEIPLEKATGKRTEMAIPASLAKDKEGGKEH